ncbi:putative Eukaryotic translation initiation factor 2 subunit beta [Blattamonas nauphoetae]|uniref:Eukaryotic translation initiation factor 2 subunit beta n=1 Tax=Blattamonas nauphoetae TaxID=2049346 RepID=A0ABQ9YEK4_9EUKA|nr:putative Eukaryotic translation initiation factor 2 subunit beta [Blattamonas nauphoetae]
MPNETETKLSEELIKLFGMKKRPRKRQVSFFETMKTKGFTDPSTTSNDENKSTPAPGQSPDASSQAVVHRGPPTSVYGYRRPKITFNSDGTTYDNNVPELPQDVEMTYEDTLDKCRNILAKNHPELVEHQKTGNRIRMRTPIVQKGTGRNTMVNNFEDVCKSIHRPIDHVEQFLLTELGCKGNLNPQNALILREKYDNVAIEKVLRQYVLQYVQCPACKSANTIFRKSDRITEIICEECQASRHIASIKQQGAITKVRRRQ